MRRNISIIILIILISIFIIPTKVKSAVIDLSKYTSEDLVTTFNKEGITSYDLTKYNIKNDKRINIYIFRGDGCQYCKNLYTSYIATKLLASHGDKIKITSYEVRNNTLNYNLLDKAKTLLNEQAGSYATPTMFIGNKTFSGDLVITDAAQKQTEIENAIDALYNSNNRYDIIEELAGKNVFADNTNNITLTSNTRLDKNYTLKVNKVDNANIKAEEGYEYIVSYDITMYNGTTVVPLNNGSYKIRIPINAKYDKYKVGYIKDGKIQENFVATYNNNYIEFTTTHLSEYAVYGANNKTPDSNQNGNQNTNTNQNGNINKNNTTNTNKNTVNEKNPQTLDTIQTYITILALGSITLITSIIILKKKRV